jgi:hypothetical protein
MGVLLRCSPCHLRYPADNPEGTRAFTRAFSPHGGDEIHYAAGIGFAFVKIQIDLGVDLSEHRDSASLSAVYSF